MCSRTTARDPVAREIAGFIDALSEDEQIDLVALMRLGRGDGTIEEWEDLAAARPPKDASGPHRALSARRAHARRSPRRRPRMRSASPGRRSGPRRCRVSYRAQSTMTVPSLSPFSTARCACAVSDSANCAAMLWMRGPAASHFDDVGLRCRQQRRWQREQHQRAQRDAFLHQFAHRHHRRAVAVGGVDRDRRIHAPSVSAWSRYCRRNRHRRRGRRRAAR